jgi:hypothetical protein
MVGSHQPLGEEPSTASGEESASKSSYSKAHSSLCDRRLSRAAREILKRKLQQTTRLLADSDDSSTAGTAPTSTNNANENGDKGVGADTNVWELLDRFLVPNGPDAATLSKCPFLPSRDLLRYHEEHALTVKAQAARYSATSAPLVGRRRTGGRPAWHQCAFCNKTFSSRYYIDQHFDNRHSQELSSEMKTSKSSHEKQHDNSIGDNDADPSIEMDMEYYCPAVEWCAAFSDQACQDMALELEPYYDRGSDGYGNDRWTVSRKLSQAAHAVPCTTAAMEETTRQCRQIVGACFGGAEGGEDALTNKAVPDGRRLSLEESLCPTMSCHGRLHQLFAGASTGVRAASSTTRTNTGSTTTVTLTDRIHEWQDEWTYYNQEHGKVGWMGLLLIVGLVLWYVVKVIQQQQHRAAQPRRTTAGTRLLRKSSSTGGSWSAPSWSSTSALAGRKPKTH